MSNFHLTYSGGSGEMPSDPEEVAAVMAQWEAWYGNLGASLVDGGAPFGARQTISSDGSVSDGGPSTGYTIVTADDLADAVAKAKGCPVLATGGAVEVSECMDM